MRNFFAFSTLDERVIDCDWGTECGALRAADVDWCEGVFLTEAAGLKRHSVSTSISSQC